tara:strand:+ start:381 stop:1613 length:1233 start_codon:yes stop_codon:yes gene_type:complete
MTPEEMQAEMDRLQASGVFAGTQASQAQSSVNNMNAQMQGLQSSGAFKGAPPPPAKPPPGLLSRMGTGINNFRQDPEKMARLTMGLNSMRLNPDQGIAASAAQTIQTAQEDKRLDKRANATIKTLQTAAKSGDALAKATLEAIQANPSEYLAYFNAYAKEKIKGRSAIKQMSGGQLNAMPGGGAYDPAAMYNVTEDSSGTKISKIGGGGTTVNNNAASGMAPGLKKLDEAYAVEHLEWTRGGGSDMAANVAQINTVLQRLEDGEELTGPLTGMINNLGLLGIVNPDAENAKEMVQEVVQRNLKTILGAQFAQKEGEQLISRAYNPTLSPELNARRLRKLYQQMEIARQQREAMAAYFNKNYTLRGYEGPQPNISNFYTALSEFSVGETKNGYKYLGGDSQKESSWEKVGN